MRQVYRIFFRESFEATEEKNKAHCFIAGEDHKTPVNETACRSFTTLFELLEDRQFIYWTPNTFYNGHRLRKNLRWLNAFFVDIDLKDNPGLTYPDLLDRITVSGLPLPSLIVQSPSGGFHIYWAINSARATFKTIRLYEVLTRLIAGVLGADQQAIGAERYLRLPRHDNILYYDENCVYCFDDFKDWREINNPEEISCTGSTIVKVLPKGILSHPAFQKLLRGVEIGIRDNTCFTLALAFRSEGYTQEQTQGILQEWNRRNPVPLNSRDIYCKIRSAYSGKYRGPSAKWVTYLSGIQFSYRLLSAAKPRHERKRSHISEWAQDILDFLADNEGTWSGSQSELAKLLSAPLRSIKEALKWLVKGVKISLKVEGRGRSARTVITQIKPSKTVKIFPTGQTAPKPAQSTHVQNLHCEIVHTDLHPLEGPPSLGGIPSLRGSPG